MTEQPLPHRAPRSPARTRRFRAGAAVALVLAAAIIAVLVLRDSGEDSSSGADATSVTPAQIKSLAASVEHPVFWLGPREGYTYELTRTKSGSIFIRYLPEGVQVGSKDAYLTVATYPFPGALPALRKVASDTGASRSRIRIAKRGLAVPSKRAPQSVHIAYPGVDYQVEVFDPKAGAAKEAVTSGQLTAFGSLESTAPKPAEKATAASVDDLTSLATSVGHPVYWLGPMEGHTYELLQTASGRIFIRYLPKGVAVGTKQPYLTVATYPLPGAFGAIQALAKTEETIELEGGGLAVVDAGYLNSIHLAYPDSDFQVEVFDPSPARVRQLVSSGRVTEVG